MSDTPPPDRDDLPEDPFGPGEFGSAEETEGHPAAGGSSPEAGAASGFGPAGFGTGGSGGAGPFGFSAFGGMFSDLARMLGSQGPLSWDVARQLALWSASEGRPEANVDPVERIRYEELCRIAELHVSDIGGLPVSDGGRGVTVEAVTRAAWAARFLEEQRDLLDRLARALGGPEGEGGAAPGEADPAGELFTQLTRMMGPMMLGLQVGSMAGQLARRCLATYDLPLPGRPGDRLVFVPANVAAFAAEWSLPVDVVRMRLCVLELARHAVLRRPGVRDRLIELLGRFAGSYRVDPSALESRLGDIDPSDPGSFERVLGDPQVLLGAVQTAGQTALAGEISAVVSALEGWVEHVAAAVAPRLLGSDRMALEAFKRRRIEASSGDRLAERLLGLTLDQAVVDRGERFVRGVVERAGDAGLARLWESGATLPTPAEIDAPGLWLARLETTDEGRP